MNYASLSKKIIKGYTTNISGIFHATRPKLSSKISGLAKDVVEFTRKPLNKNSEAARFFGVTNSQDVTMKAGQNQSALIEAYSWYNNIPEKTFPNGTILMDIPEEIAQTRKEFFEQFKFIRGIEGRRMTLCSKTFGEHGLHTIGFVYDGSSSTLYCLDSLSNKIPQVANYQRILKEEIISAPYNKIERVIFSNKPQQGFNEYTSNNWALENILRVQEALKEGKKINSTEELNAILPDDINKVLHEQQSVVIWFN